MRILYIIVGIAAFVLGTIGTVLPVLPTVPFYLLATWCFARSSKRLHDWLNSKPLYRKHMTPFFNGEGLTLRQKVTMMSVTTILMLIAFVLFAAAAYVTSAVSAGALEFWHVWGWFI